jgi:hypothetical protein
MEAFEPEEDDRWYCPVDSSVPAVDGDGNRTRYVFGVHGEHDLTPLENQKIDAFFAWCADANGLTQSEVNGVAMLDEFGGTVFGEDRNYLLRHLQGVGWSNGKALDDMRAHLAWREANLPAAPLCAVEDLLRQGMIYVHGVDNKYRPVVIIKVGQSRHEQRPRRMRCTGSRPTHLMGSPAVRDAKNSICPAECTRVLSCDHNHYPRRLPGAAAGKVSRLPAGNPAGVQQLLVHIMEHLKEHVLVPGKAEQLRVVIDLADVSLTRFPAKTVRVRYTGEGTRVPRCGELWALSPANPLPLPALCKGPAHNPLLTAPPARPPARPPTHPPTHPQVHALVTELHGNYRGRMHALYFHHAPFLFWGAWRVLSAVLPAHTTRKIRIDAADLVRDVGGADRLPAAYGGSCADLIPGDADFALPLRTPSPGI